MIISSAYDKMLKDGSASKPIRISQPTPDNPTGGMGGSKVLGESDDDWSEFDSKMQEYMTLKRSKRKSKSKSESKPKSESNTIKKLEKRIVLLEGIVEKIMRAQMDILKNG